MFDWCPEWMLCDLPARRRWLMSEFSNKPGYQKIEELHPDHLDEWDQNWVREYPMGRR